MTVPIEMDTYVTLGAIQRQHDLFLNHAYRAGLHNRANLDAIARDEETLYHIEAVEALSTKIWEYENP